MNPRISAALAQLNAVYAETGRQYRIIETEAYILVMPSGGTYPLSNAEETIQRLVRLTHAAMGRH